MLIEKGLAKLFGGYEGIHFGQIADAFQLLTGLYTKSIYFHFPGGRKNPKLDAGVLFEELCRYNEAGLLMAAGSVQPTELDPGKRADSQQNQGIVTGHAYSLMNVRHFRRGEISRQEEKQHDVFTQGGPDLF